MPRLNLATVLRRPYRGRTRTLYETISSMIALRHEIIHRAALDLTLTDERVDKLIYDLDAAITRTQKAICSYHGWRMYRGWYLGRKTRRTKELAGAAELAITTSEASEALK